MQRHIYLPHLILFFLFSLLFSARVFAFHEASYGLQLASYAGGTILANPPLPMLYFKGGNQKLSLQPAYVEGSIDSVSTPSSQSFRTVGQIYGGGGALGYSYALGNSFGLYFLAVGDQIGGHMSYINTVCTPFCNTVSTNNIKATFATAGLGLMWTVVGGDANSFFSLGLFGGPAITAANLSQRVVQTDSSGTLTDDFEMEVKPTVPSVFVGLQMGFRFGNSLLVNPYFVGFNSLADKCHNYKVTKINVDGSLDGESTSQCGGTTGGGPGTARNKIDLNDGITALGVNVAFLPLNLAINVLADSGKPKDNDLKSFKLNTYLISFSIGTD